MGRLKWYIGEGGRIIPPPTPPISFKFTKKDKEDEEEEDRGKWYEVRATIEFVVWHNGDG